MTAHCHVHPERPEALPNPFWLLPVGAVVGSAWFILTMDGEALLQQAFIGAMWGAFGAVPVVIVAAFILIGLHNRRARSLWKARGLDWYRSSFPEHAAASDAVSCRYCGADRLQPRNLAGQRDVRAFACSLCGETLYYVQE